MNARRYALVPKSRRARFLAPRACRLSPRNKAETMSQSSLEIAENVNSQNRSSDLDLEEPQIPGPHDLDWRRLKGYKAACNIKKNPSWIWQHGYRLWNEDELEFWLCKRCHHGPVKRPFPKGHIFQTTRATSTAAQHMTKQHSISENGKVTPSRPPSKRRKLEDCNFGAKYGATTERLILRPQPISRLAARVDHCRQYPFPKDRVRALPSAINFHRLQLAFGRSSPKSHDAFEMGRQSVRPAVRRCQGSGPVGRDTDQFVL